MKLNYRNKPPINTKTPNFIFPKYIKENFGKITLYFLEDRTQPLINIRVIFPVGASSDSIPGLSNFTAGLMTKGTKEKSSRQIAEDAEMLGASISSGSGWDYTYFSAVALSKYFDSIAEIASSCIFDSAFENDEIERHRIKTISSIMHEESDLNYLAQVNLNQELFKNFPYGHPKMGKRETIKKIQRNDCLDHYSKVLNNDFCIIVAGNISFKGAMDSINKYFILKSGSIHTKPVESQIFPKIPKINKRIIITEKTGTSQISLKVGMLTASKNSQDYPALTIANIIFGGYFMSRLNSLLREKRGVTYGANSFIDSRKLASSLVIDSSINAESTNQTLTDILNLLADFSSKPATEDELKLAVQYSLGSFMRSIETPQQTASMLQTMYTLKLRADFYDYFFKNISAQTLDSVFEVQQKYFIPDDIIISASGNSELLKNELFCFSDNIKVKKKI